MFGSAAQLATITVDTENEIYFVEDNVLYRNVEGAEGYELVTYPAARVAEGGKNAKSYVVKEGTLRIYPYAFYGLNKNALNKVTLPIAFS